MDMEEKWIDDGRQQTQVLKKEKGRRKEGKGEEEKVTEEEAEILN